MADIQQRRYFQLDMFVAAARSFFSPPSPILSAPSRPMVARRLAVNLQTVLARVAPSIMSFTRRHSREKRITVNDTKDVVLTVARQQVWAGNNGKCSGWSRSSIRGGLRFGKALLRSVNGGVLQAKRMIKKTHCQEATKWSSMQSKTNLKVFLHAHNA